MKLDFHDFPGMIKLDPEIRPPASSSQLPALIPDLDLDVAAQLFPCLGIVVDVEPKHQPQERICVHYPPVITKRCTGKASPFLNECPMKTSIHRGIFDDFCLPRYL